MKGKYSRALLLSVNGSTKQLESEGFFEELTELLRRSAFDPITLQLEITESIFLHDANRLGELLKSIRRLGIKIAFDDFGAGYSSIIFARRTMICTT